jgi:hypothetical protein
MLSRSAGWLADVSSPGPFRSARLSVSVEDARLVNSVGALPSVNGVAVGATPAPAVSLKDCGTAQFYPWACKSAYGAPRSPHSGWATCIKTGGMIRFG